MNQPTKSVAFPQKLLFGGAFLVLTLGSLLSPALSSPDKSTLEDSPKAVVDEVWQLVNNEFVDKEFNHLNWQRKRQELLSKTYTNRKQAYKAIEEALQELGDPYTRFLTPDKFAQLTSQTSGELSGVGVRLTLDQKNGQLLVVESLKNSPAMKAGIKADDHIIRINGKPTALMTLEQATNEMQGKLGTPISLQVSRQGTGIFEVTLTRVQIEIPSVSYTIKDTDQVRVGYIKLDEFSSHAAEQMKEAIQALGKQKISGYVLDLRGNPGGLLVSSVDIARMWLKKGAIVSMLDRSGGDRRFAANGTALTDLPLVILVNEGSASASEILTGALKENQRATIVGTTTYGKGTVQSVHSLSDGSGLAVTIAHYYPPSGTDINKKGIKPDIFLDLTTEQQLLLRNDPSLLATHEDPQYNRAIAVFKDRPLAVPPSVPKPIGTRLPNS